MGIVYLTTNIINNKKYIGVDTNNNDKYFGSGTIMKLAIKKYGIEKFKKEILFESVDNDTLFTKEKELIDFFNAVESKNYYNLADGGKGGAGTLASKESKEKHRIGGLRVSKINIEKRKGKTYEEIYGDRAEEEKEKRKQAGLGKKYSKERIQKSAETRKGSIPWNKGKKGVQVSWTKGRCDIIHKIYELEFNGNVEIIKGKNNLKTFIKNINKNKKHRQKINIDKLIINKKEKGYNLKIIPLKNYKLKNLF